MEAGYVSGCVYGVKEWEMTHRTVDVSLLQFFKGLEVDRTAPLLFSWDVEVGVSRELRDGEENVFDEAQDSVALDLLGRADGLLQLGFDHVGLIQEVNLRVWI